MRTVNHRIAAITLYASSMCLFGASASAHHSGAMFDMMHCRTLQGTVRSVQWNYPHSWLWIDAQNTDSTSAVWGFEGPSPTQLEHIDALWTRDVIAKGDKIQVRFGPLKDGRNGGALAAITLASGRTLIGSPGLCEGNPNPAADGAASPARQP